MTLYLGIDPGLSGAIAAVRNDGTLHSVHDMPTIAVEVGKKQRNRLSEHAIIDLLNSLAGEGVAMAMLEAVGPMPRDGAASAFAFGESFGVIKASIAAARLPLTLITPQKWKRAAGLDHDKGKSRMMAQRYWPGEAKLFARVKDDGRAESALLARHGWTALHRVLEAA